MRGFWSRVLLGTAGRTVVLECRRCGTPVDGTTETCPQCGSSEIARYEIP